VSEKPVLAPRQRDELDPGDAPIYDHIINTRKLGFMPDMFAIMGHSPHALEPVAAVGEHVRFHCKLDADLREMVICQVAKEVRNVYEWCHHIYKVPEQLRSTVGTPAIEDEPAPIGPVMRYTRLVAANEDADDALIEEIRTIYGNEGLVDITVMVGYYQLLGSFCRVLRVPLEDAVAFVPFPGE